MIKYSCINNDMKNEVYKLYRERGPLTTKAILLRLIDMGFERYVEYKNMHRWLFSIGFTKYRYNRYFRCWYYVPKAELEKYEGMGMMTDEEVLNKAISMMKGEFTVFDIISKWREISPRSVPSTHEVGMRMKGRKDLVRLGKRRINADLKAKVNVYVRKEERKEHQDS